VETFYELVTYNREVCDAVTTLELHLPRYSGRHALPGFEELAAQIAAGLTELAAAIEVGRPASTLPPYPATLDRMHAYMRDLEATRGRELGADAGHTSTREAVRDFTRVMAELDRLADEVTEMQAALARQTTAPA
jgi:hypothetical protein